MSKDGVISGPNTGKYGPEITPYLDTFHPVGQQLLIVTKTSYIYQYIPLHLCLCFLQSDTSKLLEVKINLTHAKNVPILLCFCMSRNVRIVAKSGVTHISFLILVLTIKKQVVLNLRLEGVDSFHKILRLR